jgi:predicted dehydrogenase
MQRTRIAVIGAGLIGGRHLGVLAADPAYEAVVADPGPAAEALARRVGVPYFADYERMLDEAGPHGAIVATPNQHHVTAGLACISRGVPVLIEKPIADSVPEALELMAAADGAGVAVLTGHHRRHNPILKRAAEAIANGAVGRVTAVVCLWLSHKPDDYFDVAWRKQPGGGPVLINGIHEIDCMRMLCGEIESVQARTATGARNFAVEDTAAAILAFSSGALGTLILSDTVSSPWNWEWGSYENEKWPHESQNCYLVTGTRGSLAIPSLELWWHEAGECWTDPLTRRRIPYVPADSYVEQMRNFVQVIRGEAEPVVSGWDGTRTLAATLAITESARTGRPVAIGDMLESAGVRAGKEGTHG